MPDDPKQLNLVFPLKGIDVTQEFQLQPPGTTPDALNVFSQDAIAHRNRGGSRPGLTKKPAGQLNRGTTVFQHLNLIVDPSTDALPQNFYSPEPDWIPHPRFPDVLVPPEGTGDQIIEQSSPGIAFVQSKFALATSGAEVPVTFNSNVTIGNEVLLFVSTNTSSAGTQVSVVNNSSVALTQVGGYVELQSPVILGTYVSLSLWRIRATAAGNTTLKVTPSTSYGSVALGALEYSGVRTTLPVDDTAENSDTNLGPANMTTGNLLIGFNGDMAIAGFSNTGDATPGWTVGAGQNSRINEAATSHALRITDRLPVNAASSPITMTADVDGGDIWYVALGASFRKR